MKFETLKIDTSYAGYKDAQLEKMLSEGWTITDKTVLKDRFIYYILAK